MSELKGIVTTRGNLKSTINSSVKTKAAVSVGGTLIGAKLAERGMDGYSPTATVTKVGDTATITITDKNGTTTAQIHDGSGGGGASAFIAEYGVTTYADVKDAYDEDAIIICTVDDSGNTAICQLAYFDDANDTFYFAQPMSDGFYLTSIAIGDTWDDGFFQFASTDTATQLRDGLMSALDKQKLDTVASGAEVNVQADWSQSDNTKDDYIKNKPTIPSKVSDLSNDSGFISTETDPVFASSPAYGISASDISDWNDKSKVSVTQVLASGTKIATVTVDGTGTDLYAPSGGGSGTVTDVTQNGVSVVVSGVAAVTVPTDTSDLTNGAGFLSAETDPTVPSWAKEASKPSYTFSEIASTPTTISGYGITDAKISSGTITLGSSTITPLTSFTETDPIFSSSPAYGIGSSNISAWNAKAEVAKAIPFATCATAALTSPKLVTIPEITELTTGLIIAVKFSLTNSVADPQLKVNSLDAKPIRRYSSTSPGTSASTSWRAGQVVMLAYDGTAWQMVDWTNEDTTYSSLGQSEMQTGTSTAARLITAARLKEAIGYHPPASHTHLKSEITDFPTIPSDTSDLTNGAGFISTETDPTVPSWAKEASKPSYSFSEIGSTPTTISGYGITDAKITSGTITLGSSTITPLTSYTETDPVFTSSPAYGISAADITAWNAKTAVSVSRHTTSGTNIADITIDGTTTKIYAPTSGSVTGTLVQLVRW